MAEFYTQFSCLLDVGSAENAAQALDLYTAFCAEPPRILPDHTPSRGFPAMGGALC